MALGISEAVELAGRVSELVKKGITIDLQERVAELREAVLNAKDEVLRLREDNQSLRESAQRAADWAARLAEYELLKTPGLTILYRFKGKPEHYACPTCIESKKEIHRLQGSGETNESIVSCYGCKSKYWVERFVPYP